MKIQITKNEFNSDPYYHQSIKSSIPTTPEFVKNLPSMVDQFDQNGFDLTQLERLYAKKDGHRISTVRTQHWVLKDNWFTADRVNSGAHINHAYLFQRKGFTGKALEQMQSFAEHCPIVHKVLQMKPKWGLDFSVDYADAQGNVFEVLHWEWDSFDYDEIVEKKKYMDDFLQTIDWTESAQRILEHKSEWHHLGFFEQSAWKTNFFGIDKERFKMVIWK